MNNKSRKKSKNRRLAGIVVSDKMHKTRVVSVDTWHLHSKYLKQYKVTNRFKAHDEKNEYKTGDKVIIEETRPVSREKRWKIIGLAQKLKPESE